MKKFFKFLLLLSSLLLSYLGGLYTPANWSTWLKTNLEQQTQRWLKQITPATTPVKQATAPSKIKYRDLLVTTPQDAGPFGVMVNIYSDPAHGETLNAQLTKAGFSTRFIAVEDNQNLGWSLLVVGEFVSYTEAKRSADNIAVRFPLQTRIIRLPQPSA